MISSDENSLYSKTIDCHQYRGLWRIITEKFNSFSYDINFTYKFDKENISFLDLNVISSNGKLITILYCKPTDCHQ